MFHGVTLTVTVFEMLACVASAQLHRARARFRLFGNLTQS